MDTQKKINNIIAESVKKEITKKLLHENIKNLVREEVKKYIVNKINEDNGGTQDTKRKAVMNMLKDTKFNHAELARNLWHPKDKSEEDTYRSLFSKKANGTPDNDGAIRHFTEEEINQLYQILRTR